MGLAVKLGHSAEDICVFGIAGPGFIQKLFGLLWLFLLHVSDGQQQLSMGGWLHRLGALQEICTFGQITRLYEQLARHGQISGALRISSNHLQENALGIVGPAHAHIGLGHAGKTFYRMRIDLQSALISIEGDLILTGQPGAVSKQEPGIGIVRLMLGQALSIVHGCGIVALSERFGSGARETNTFNAATIPAQTTR